MMLCIDSGNSRIKYGFWADQGWQETGALAHAQCSQLADLCRGRPRPQRILLANVAGDALAERIREALGDWAGALEIVRSRAAACDVVNGYRFPEKLGVDRWCALIGARALYPIAALVVMAGTATTIDTLDAGGLFRGGLILPGQGLMLAALARDTANLPLASGHHVAWPQCTEDAIVSGAIEAQVGAIERAWARLPADAERICILSGGNAPLLAAQLSLPHVCIDNLPLLGLKTLALRT